MSQDGARLCAHMSSSLNSLKGVIEEISTGLIKGDTSSSDNGPYTIVCTRVWAFKDPPPLKKEHPHLGKQP